MHVRYTGMLWFETLLLQAVWPWVLTGTFPTNRRLDSEMKMELARRLDSALMDNNALQEEIEKLRWDLDAMARATAPSGEGGEPVSTPVAGSGSVISQARANVSFSGRPLHPLPRPGSGPAPAPSAAPAQSGGGMLGRIQLGIKKAMF